MSERLSLAGWQERVGALPPLLDYLAYDLFTEGRSEANAVAEAVRTLEPVAKSGRTQNGTRVPFRTQHAAKEALAEWTALEYLAGATNGLNIEPDLMLALDEAADSLRKASVHEPVGKPGGPGLWGHKGLQLPAYIQHIANDIREKRGKTTSQAIAIAIGAVKRWARGGGNVDAGTKAAAAKALAEWEKLKATHNKSKVREAEFVCAVARLKHVSAPISDQATFAIRYGNRLQMIEGIFSPLRDAKPLAVTTARQLLEADEGATLADLISALSERKLVSLMLLEALGYGSTPIRARTADGHKGRFHGMHGTERAVRKRSLIPSEASPLLVPEKAAVDAAADAGDDAVVAGEHEGAADVADSEAKTAELIAEAAPTLAPAPAGSGSGAAWSEELHPRAQHGQFGAKGGAGAQKPAAQQAPPPAQAATLVAALQANDPQFKQDMAATSAFTAANPGVLGGQTVVQTNLAGQQIQNIGYAPDAQGISQFQKDNGLPVTGVMDQTTLTTVQTVYRQNARTASSRVPDFTGIAGAGARIGGRRARGSQGRKTLGVSSPKKLRAAAEQEVEEAGIAVFQTRSGAPILFGPPSGTNHANTGPEGGRETRQPGGDDFDFDEPPREPPNLREHDGVHACATCVHFSPRGWVTSANVQGGCMAYTWPVDRLDMCDDWLTLTPPDAPLRVYEARLAEAVESGSGDEIVAARAVLRKMRERYPAGEALPHPADKDLAARLAAGT